MDSNHRTWSDYFARIAITCLLVSSRCRSAVASSTSYPLPYEAITKLNEYGESVQIKNSQATVDQYGRLVVAVRCAGAVWMVTPHCGAPPWSRHTRQHLLEPLTSSGCCHLVSTGLQPDAAWLLEELRTYGRNLRRELDTTVMVHPWMLTRLHRRFLGHDERRMWSGMAADTEDVLSMGRPLGVSSFLVSDAEVHQVDTSGHVERMQRHDFSLLAMGKASNIVKEHWKCENADEMERDLLSVFDLAVGAKELHIEIIDGDGHISTRILRQG